MDSRQYEIRYLPLFYEDLFRVTQYIDKRLKNKTAAQNLIMSVEDAILARSTCAEAFEPYPSKQTRENPYFAIYVKNYVIYYVVIEHRIMEVRRFLYKGQNRSELLID